MQLIYFILGIIIGGAVVYVYMQRTQNVRGQAAGREVDRAASSSSGDDTDNEGDGLHSFNEDRESEQERRHEKIMEIVRKRGEIDNDMIENKFGVSHATATRDLDELEKEGKIKANAEAGRHVVYTAKNT